MEFDLTRLKNGLIPMIEIHESYSFSKDQLVGTDVMKLDAVKIDGTITIDSIEQFILSLQIKGTMILPCSVTLEPVEYPFDIQVNGNIAEMLVENEQSEKNIGNTLDILPIIWENILMEIPMKVTSTHVPDTLEGNGWKFVTEEPKEVNPALEKLKDLL